ncbi:alba dna rna-binding protein [Stylonychia lemnae]|uniref:Alba dna rna-binding protein n=1 Tax=Stylonychia lemnae TaxID=5949 RepID=A0A078A291_STYLE|nr:alba dna rna-binding protein [Stylonychia lemnae]|eukprot:CDW76321.1 alba dna rna-binding protein [Stylonychia lemnae]
MESTKQGATDRNQPANQINVSTKKNPNFYVFLGKKYLEEHEIIELHALGNAVSISVIAAENLVRNNYATFKEIKTKTVEVSGNKDEKSKKAKLFITLQKSPQFAENMAKFNKIREENEALKKEEQTKQ